MIDSYGFFGIALLAGIVSGPSIHAACGTLATGCQQSYPHKLWDSRGKPGSPWLLLIIQAPARWGAPRIAQKACMCSPGSMNQGSTGAKKAFAGPGIAWVVHTGTASMKNSIGQSLLRNFFRSNLQVVDLYRHSKLALLAGNLAEARFFKAWRAASKGYQQSYPQNSWTSQENLDESSTCSPHRRNQCTSPRAS